MEHLFYEFIEKYKNKILYNPVTLYTPDITKRMKSLDYRKSKSYNIVNNIFDLFKKEIWIDEVLENKKKCILPPFIIQQNLNSPPYLTCPYKKKRICLPVAFTFALYVPNKSQFIWITQNYLQQMTTDIFNHLDIVQFKSIIHITREEADQLAVWFRVMWSINKCKYEIGKKKMRTSNLTIFDIEYKINEHIIIYTLANIGIKDMSQKQLNKKFNN